MSEQKGLLLKRKDYLGVDEEAGSHPNRTYYYKKNADLDDVLSTCSKSLEIDPHNAKALLLRGNTFLKLQQYQDAAKDFSLLIKVDPATIEGYYGRGVAYSKIGDHEMAIRDLSYVIQKNPDHVNALFARAACYNTIGQFSAAIEDYNIALLKDQSQNLLRAASPEKARRSSFSGSVSSRMDPDAYPPTPPDLTPRPKTPLSSPKQSKSQHMESFLKSTSKRSSPSVPQAPPHPPPAPHPSHSATIQADEFHKKGFEYRKQGNFSLAVEEYSKALELDPYHFKAFFNRAFAYDKLHDYPHAIADYTSAIALDPQNSYAFYNRGITFDKLGDYQLASEDFKHALTLQSTSETDITSGANIDFIYNLALSLKKLNQFPNAIVYFQKCLKLENGKHLKSLQSLGNCYEQLGNLEGAMECYNKALEIAPQHITSLISKAHLLHLIGGQEQCQFSIRLYSSILDLLFPDGGDAGLSSHRLHHSHPSNERRREEAISIIYSRAHVYEDLNDLKSAIRDLTLAIELASQGVGTPSGEEGVSCLRDGLTPIPLSVLYSTRGIYYKVIEKYEQAIGDFNQFFDHYHHPDPTPPSSSSVLVSVHNHRGYCYRKLDQYPQAIADYTEAISLHPSSIKGYNNRAYCYAKIGDYQKAIRDYTSVLVIDEVNAHAYHNRGISYDKLGIFDKAIEDFSKVIELDAAAAVPHHTDRLSSSSGPSPSPLGGNDQHHRHASSTPISLTSNSYLPSSGRSTPGLFTPIRSNDSGGGLSGGHGGSTTGQSRSHPNRRQQLTLRSRTPTNSTTKSLEQKELRIQESNPPQRPSNKSPTPTAVTSRSSLQESIRAKMVASPSPRTKTLEYPTSALVDHQVNDQIIGIQEAARRLASFSAPKNKVSSPPTAVTLSSSSGFRSLGKGMKLSSAESRHVHSASSPSLSSSLDGNHKSFPSSRGVASGSHRQLPSGNRSLL